MGDHDERYKDENHEGDPCYRTDQPLARNFLQTFRTARPCARIGVKLKSTGSVDVVI